MINLANVSWKTQDPDLCHLGTLTGTLVLDQGRVLFIPEEKHREALDELGLVPECGLLLDDAEVNVLA